MRPLPGEYMRGDEVVRYYMKVFHCTRSEARAELYRAIRAGELLAFDTQTLEDYGEEVPYPVDSIPK